MAYLGSVPVDAAITIRVAWTPAAGSPPITDSTLTLIHEDRSTVLAPVVGTPDGPNAWKVSTALPRSGRWRVRWATAPTGGLSDDVLYAQ
jgi:hypothetical protein